MEGWNVTVTSVFARRFFKNMILLQREKQKKNNQYSFVCFKPLGSSVHFVLQK